MEINRDTYHEQKEKEECVICMDEVEIDWRELECQHRYHTTCIEKWITIRAKCPLCMKHIRDDKPEEIHININNMPEEIQNIVLRRFLLLVCTVIIMLIIIIICNS